jgi:uncharacterized OB-fold protein
VSVSEVATDALTPAVERPLPLPDELTRFFWDAAREHRLEMLHCADCDRFIHYPQPVCPGCLSAQLAPRALSGRGVVYTYTVAEQAFHPFWADRLPYVLVVVDLAEQPGLRFVSELVDCAADEVVVGMPVEVSWEDVTEEITLPLFRQASGTEVAR